MKTPILTLTLLLLFPILLVGCEKTSTISNDDAIQEHIHQIEDIWSCDTRKEPNCMKDIYHFGYRRNGTMYVWRKGDMMPSTVCEPGECSR